MNKPKTKKKFYDLFRARTSNRIFIFAIGGRGLGKSFSLKDVFFSDYIKSGKQFILIRRYSTELDLTFDQYFNDLNKKYPEHEIKAQTINNKRCFLVDGKIAGYALSICEFKSIKSISLDDIYNIGFEEFLPEDGMYIRRNGNYYFEVDQCMNLYQTVARGYGKAFKNGVRFYFIANNTDVNNPYFRALQIDELMDRIKNENGAGIVKTPSIYAEYIDSNDYEAIDEIANSQFGQMIKGTRYGNYALSNTAYNESKEFIKGELPGGAKHLFNIKYLDDIYGVWFDNCSGFYYMVDKYDPKCKVNYALTNESHTINTVLIEKNKNTGTIKLLKDAYNNGYVLFKNQLTKFVLLTFLGIK